MKCAFLDRDGVINRDSGYLYRWEDFEFLPGAVTAMAQLHQAGFTLIVITNQSGIARGYYSEADYQQLTQRMRNHLTAQGIPLTDVYHCPHHPKGSVAPYAIQCDCRKPAPGMILQAVKEHGITLSESLLIGDKLSDIQAARAAKIGRSYLVLSENIESRKEDGMEADGVYPSLLACVEALPFGSAQNKPNNSVS